MIKSLFLAVTIVSHAPGYYTSLANHLKRWLGQEQVAASVITPASMPTALANEKIAFLVGFESPTAAEISTLKAYRARGGKLVVFHSASPALATLMDVKCDGYSAAPYPGAWSRMNFTAKTPTGLPTSVLQTSSVLQRAHPQPGKGRVIATWSDRTGRSTGEPAWIATAGGYWMTHVLLADGDEDFKAQLLGALVGSVDPQIWSLSAHRARADAEHAKWRTLALRQVPRAGEIHAVWDHSGCGLYPGNWEKTMHVLQEARVTDLFVNVAGAAFAHYASNILPRSKTFEQEGDQLAQCLKAAKGKGIRVHAWILAFSATRGTADRLENFRKKGWRLARADGKLTEYLDPSNPAVRSYVLSAVDEIQSRYAVAGVHLDFVRWGDQTVRPKDPSRVVTEFVLEARRRVKRPKWLTAAVYGKYPNCVASVGQDWKSWLDLNLVDYAVPMDYTESRATFEELLAQHALKRTHPKRIIAGIGVTANESRLNAEKVIEQINLSRKYGVAGNALFDLDTLLEKRIFPYLKLGIW